MEQAQWSPTDRFEHAKDVGVPAAAFSEPTPDGRFVIAEALVFPFGTTSGHKLLTNAVVCLTIHVERGHLHTFL
jgi:hypothetical protein